MRAVATSCMPVISAVGHEIDSAITDFAADVRAATPSEAAELAVPDKREVVSDISGLLRDAVSAAKDALYNYRREIADIARSYGLKNVPRDIERRYQDIDELTVRSAAALRMSVALKKAKLDTETARMGALNPRATMRRGYAIAVGDDDRIVRSATETASGSPLNLILIDGRVRVNVEEIGEENTFGEG